MKFIPHRTSTAFNPQNRVKFIHGGKEFFDTLEKMLDEAGKVIHFQTYIFSDDGTGKRIKDALVRASERGVRVYLLCDGYATGFSDAWIREFLESGIYFRYFEPLFSGKKFYFGRRLHHKVVVCDERFSLVGGINISDRYHGTRSGRKDRLLPRFIPFAAGYGTGKVPEAYCPTWNTNSGFQRLPTRTPPW